MRDGIQNSARDPWFDNSKIAIMVLVVGGHVIEAWQATSAFASIVYSGIYLFHMPAIIVISGAFSARLTSRGLHLAQAARFLLIFMIMQAACLAIYQYIAGVPVAVYFSTPAFALWFLPALAIWIVLAPMLLRLRFAIPISVVVAVVAGYVPEIGQQWSLSRIIVFMPFFLIGWQLGANGVRHVSAAMPAAPVVLVASIALGVFLVAGHGGHGLLHGSRSFHELGLTGLSAGFARSAHLGLAAIAVFAFLALVPARQLYITSWGTRTLEIYLLHAVAVYSARLSGVLPDDPTAYAISVGLALWAGTLWAFSRPGFSAALRPLLHPYRSS